MNYDTAARLAGVLYGNVLHRDADEAGFAHYLEELSNNRLTVREAVRQLYSSREFVVTFVINQTPQQLAENLLTSFYDPADKSELEVQSLACELIERSFAEVVSGLIHDQRFFNRHGLVGIPRYAE